MKIVGNLPSMIQAKVMTLEQALTMLVIGGRLVLPITVQHGRQGRN